MKKRFTVVAAVLWDGNKDLVEELKKATGHPCAVDDTTGTLYIGYGGRALRVEKGQYVVLNTSHVIPRVKDKSSLACLTQGFSED